MILHADARHLPLKDESVQMCVTSPPYYGLRDYDVEGQIGLEPTPTQYVMQLVQVFGEVYRALKPGGTLWLNLGDSYGSTAGNTKTGLARLSERLDGCKRNDAQWATVRGDMHGFKRPDNPFGNKQLMGIPWRVAFALQQAGWYLRSDIIWHKPNPMPESVTDRPTKAHEYLFLLAKSERYFYDADAIAEPVSVAMLQEMEEGYDGLGLKDYEAAGVQNPSTVKARIIERARIKVGASRDDGQQPHSFHLGKGWQTDGATRNRRSVWSVPTMPYAGAHFATMPEKLVEPCILAGSRPGDIVLDPFLGSGTVGAVAERLGRRWIGCDLNPAYHELAQERTAQRGLIFDEGVSPL